MVNTTFPPWPVFAPEEIEAATEVLRSGRVNYWTGDEGRRFEDEFAAWCGTRHAVAVSNGTVALDLSLKALGIGPGDEVIVTPRSFIASVTAVVNAGARPVFADVDRDSGNLTAGSIRSALSSRTKAVVAVHLAGWPCDMDPIMELAAKHNLKVIEDCAQAHGARYKGRSVGSIGHIGAWSFCQDKIMTTAGEGGMVTTNDPDLWRAMWSYKDHGKDWERVHEKPSGMGFRWLHESFGTNWRMLEIQAVIGRLQLRKMAHWTAARGRNAEALREALRSCPVLRMPEFACNSNRCAPGCASRSQCVHGYYKFYAYVFPEKLGRDWSRDRIVEEINAHGVPCYQGICPEIYLEKAFDRTAWRPSQRLPVARELGETSLMFLVHPTITSPELERACKVASDVLGEASR